MDDVCLMCDPKLNKADIDKLFDVCRPYIGKSAMDAECAYSDSELFVKRKDICCGNVIANVDGMYSDYVRWCVDQKAHYKGNKEEYEKREQEIKDTSSCPQFDYDTIRCVIMGLLLVNKNAMVQAICADWKSDMRVMYLDIIESMTDDDNASLCRKHFYDDHKETEWSDKVKPNDSDYLLSMNALKGFDKFIDTITGMNEGIMEKRVEKFVLFKVFDEATASGEGFTDDMEFKFNNDDFSITIRDNDGKQKVIDCCEVKDRYRAEIANHLFLNK